jgi:transcriptional regulator with XRE-family HTH domain
MFDKLETNSRGVARLPKPVDLPPSPPKVGESLHRLRMARRMTLEELARIAGVSKSMLSEIERDKANPTIAMAWRLATALGLTLNQLFAPGGRDAETVQVVGRHATPTLGESGNSHVLRILGPMELAGRFEWYDLTLAPGGALESQGHDLGTVEHLTVRTGAVDVRVGEVTRHVRGGETARYPADHAHAITNAGTVPAHALLVVIHGPTMT